MATIREQRTASTLAAVGLDGAGPQDVERATADGAFHVLQSRRVTGSGEDTGQERVPRPGSGGGVAGGVDIRRRVEEMVQ